MGKMFKFLFRINYLSDYEGLAFQSRNDRIVVSCKSLLYLEVFLGHKMFARKCGVIVIGHGSCECFQNFIWGQGG